MAQRWRHCRIGQAGSVCMFVFMLLGSAAQGFASAWTLPEGSGKLITTATRYRADDRFDASGNRAPQPEFRKAELNPYVEYGWSDRLTLGGSALMQRIANRAATPGQQVNYGITDAELFLRRRLWQTAGIVLSAQPLVKLPRLEARDNAAALGSPHPEAALSLHAGFDFSHGKLNHYADFSLGYRKRFGESSDQIAYTETIAFSPAKPLTVLLQSFGTYSMEGTFDPSSFTLSSRDDYHLLTLQASVVYHMDSRTSVQLGAFDHVMGANTGSGHGFLFAVWRNF